MTKKILLGELTESDVMCVENLATSLDNLSEEELIEIRETAQRSNRIARAAINGLSSARETLLMKGGSDARIYDAQGSQQGLGRRENRLRLNL